MEIAASVESEAGAHHAAVSTDGRASTIAVGGRPAGGSALNGGELLCLALATCYCNDLYREAALRGIVLNGVRVDVVAQFGAAGEPARHIEYHAQLRSDAPPTALEALLAHTDTVAEVHNTLRVGIPVTRVGTPIATRPA